jgi:hypothetical protein
MAEAEKSPSYIVTFKLGVGGNLEGLIGLIKSYGTWGKINDNTYVVRSLNDKAPIIRDRLLAYLGSGGRLFVLRSGYEAAWQNIPATNDWLKKNL